MLVKGTPLPGLLVITPKRFADERGFFAESYNEAAYRDHGISARFVQDNHSFSEAAGTLRGLHFQTPPRAQAKLVRCGRGALFDVAVDIRKGSPTYGRWFGIELSFENGRQLFIPSGFAHGLVTRAPQTEVIYKCTAFYAPENEVALRFDDPDLGIDWGLEDKAPILSAKDLAAGAFADLHSPFNYEGGL